MTTITVNYTVERLKEALRFYAERELYIHDDDCSRACEDEGEVARKALKALEAES